MKKLIVGILTLCLTHNAYAQLLGDVKMDPKAFIQIEDSSRLDVKMVKEAVRPVFFLARQSFQVSDKETHELFGLNNREEFGTELSLGIMTVNGWLLTDRAIHPWAYDAKFTRYKEKYAPVPYISEYAEFAKGTGYDSLDISNAKVNPLLENALYMVKTDRLAGKGLSPLGKGGRQQGWIIWACIDKKDTLSPCIRLHLISSVSSLNTDKPSAMEAPANVKVLGGLFIVPDITAPGKIELKICGVMIERKDKWQIVFPFSGDVHKEEKVPSDRKTATADKTTGDSLTPVDKGTPATTGKRKNKKEKKAEKTRKQKKDESK